MNARTYLIGGITLILLSIAICAASAWNMIWVEPTVTPVVDAPTNTPLPPTDTSPRPLASSTMTALRPTSTPVSAAAATEMAGDRVSAPATPVGESNPSAPSPIIGIVATDSGRLNLRRGPGVNYGLVTRLENGVKVTILRQTPEGDWLEIQTETQQTGWATAQFIEVSDRRQDIPVATNLPPTPIPAAVSEEPSGPLALNVYGGRASGSLAPYTEQWYTFAEGDSPGSILLVLMFDPNVNLNGDAAHFFIYDEQQIPTWPPHDPDALPNLGAGSRPGADRDGDLGNGELIWRGGPLQRNRHYYVRLTNNSTSILKYCLTSRDAYQWDCR